MASQSKLLSENDEQRRLLAEITVIAFIAVAFHESLNTFRESLESDGFPWEALGVFCIFLFTTLRFFLGNHLHLQRPELLSEDRWWADFAVILLECIVLGFLGSVSPLIRTNMSSFGFRDVLLFLYAVDVAWIFGSQSWRERTRPWRWNWQWDEEKEFHWPWPWGVINTSLLLFTFFFWRVPVDIFAPHRLLLLVIVNGFFFALDLLSPLILERFFEGLKRSDMDDFLRAAIDEARQGLATGGIPIGAVLVVDGKIIGRGHNQRVQEGSAIRHAEMDCLENTGRLLASQYELATLYSTLSPCDMCSGAVLLYKIPRVIVGENRTFRGPEDYLRSRGVDVQVVNSPECIRLMEEFIRNQPALWNEDIGKPA